MGGPLGSQMTGRCARGEMAVRLGSSSCSTGAPSWWWFCGCGVWHAGEGNIMTQTFQQAARVRRQNSTTVNVSLRPEPGMLRPTTAETANLFDE